MSLRKIDVQYVGNCLRLPRLERDVAAIETEDGKVYKPVETCHSDNEPERLYGDKWHVFRCSKCHNKVDLCYNSLPRFCPECGAKVEDDRLKEKR